MDFRLRAFRKAVGLSQTELGERVGKSLRTIGSWEDGESYPNAKSLYDLCNLFGVDPDTLLGWEGRRTEGAPPPTPDESELLANYRACTPEWRRTVQMTAIAACGESLRASDRPAPDAIGTDGE